MNVKIVFIRPCNDIFPIPFKFFVKRDMNGNFKPKMWVLNELSDLKQKKRQHERIYKLCNIILYILYQVKEQEKVNNYVGR